MTMTNKINMLEHDNNVLAFENINLQIKLKRLEDELKNEKARVRFLRKVWDQTTRDLVKAEDQVEREIMIRDSILDDLKAEAIRADKLDHALNVANQALYAIDRG